MGLDYIRTKMNAFAKLWRDGRNRLALTDLLTVAPDWDDRLLLVDIFEGIELAPGEDLLLHLDGERVLVVRDTQPVGVILDPPDGLVQAMRERCHGSAIGQVRDINRISHTAQLALKPPYAH